MFVRLLRLSIFKMKEIFFMARANLGEAMLHQVLGDIYLGNACYMMLQHHIAS